MVGSLTVLTALLARLGDKVDRLHVPLVSRLRSDAAKDGSGARSRPCPAAARCLVVVAGGLLVALAVPALQLRMV